MAWEATGRSPRGSHLPGKPWPHAAPEMARVPSHHSAGLEVRIVLVQVCQLRGRGVMVIVMVILTTGSS